MWRPTATLSAMVPLLMLIGSSAWICVSTEGLHSYTCMLTSSHPTKIVKQCVLCVRVCAAGLLCMKRAVLQWAGPEQAGSVQLLPFLESNCKAWTNLAAAAGEQGGGVEGGGRSSSWRAGGRG